MWCTGTNNYCGFLGAGDPPTANPVTPSSLWREGQCILPHIRHQLVEGRGTAVSHTSGPARGGDGHCILPHIGHWPVEGMGIVLSHTSGTGPWRGWRLVLPHTGQTLPQLFG